MSVILYSQPNFRGSHKHVVARDEPDLSADGWATTVDSFQVLPGTGTWQLSSQPNNGGQYVTLGPGSYASRSSAGMATWSPASVRHITLGTPGIGSLGVILYDKPDFEGAHKHIVERDEPDLHADNWGDRVSSIVVLSGRWAVFEGRNFQQPRAVLRPGLYPRVADAGLPDKVLSSLRRLGAVRWGSPDPAPGTSSTGTNTEGIGFVTPIIPRVWEIVASFDVPTINVETILYEHIEFRGAHRHLINRSVGSLHTDAWGDRVSSVQVISGPHWTFCEDINFGGARVPVAPGSYPRVSDLGIPNDSISSVSFP
jgi:hypothetical protein